MVFEDLGQQWDVFENFFQLFGGNLGKSFVGWGKYCIIDKKNISSYYMKTTNNLQTNKQTGKWSRGGLENF